MEIQNTLGFKLPERTTAPAGSMLSNPKEVSNWVSALPMANVGETSRQVFKTIVEFNRLDLSNINRIKVAELFRRPISYISENLHKYYYDVPFPLTAKNRKIAVLNRELYTELALAYKIFIEEMVSGSSGKFDRKLLIIAIHRVIRYLSMVLYQSAIVYDPIPPTVWKEIHLLYAYAEQNNIHTLPIKDGKDEASVSTIENLYKQVLLFSICAPYRMRQREIELLQRSLDMWAEQTELDSPADSALTPYHFVARLTADAPPKHGSLETQTLNQRYRILNTQPLVQTLRELFDQLPPEQRGGNSPSRKQPSAHVLRQLIQVLSSEPKREFVRTKLNFELKVAVGITATHTLLTPDQVSEEPETDPQDDTQLDWVDQKEGSSLNQSLYTLSEQKLTLNGFDETVQETIVASSFDEPGFGSMGIPTWASGQSEQQFETFACKTINESAGGYCIQWQGINAPKIKIGEIIGIQSATQANQFGIGISRWMKYTPGQGLQLGMQMISPNASAVLIDLLNSENPSSAPQKGLLLPEMKSSQRPASLILPTLPFKVEDGIMIRSGNGKRKAKLTRLLETTGAFAHFQFSYLTSQPGDEDTKEENHGSDFDTIWSTL
ncbi:MAG: hypothetical protein OQL27_00900 [Sedimenticola sp.]|nr:hypothetical protein [Sedimenticola sp.]